MEPPKKKQRLLSKACEGCKVRKAKCDSGSPCCGACRKRGTECVYKEKEQPGLRPGFGKSLEQRLIRMDDTLQHIQQMLQTYPHPLNFPGQPMNDAYDSNQLHQPPQAPPNPDPSSPQYEPTGSGEFFVEQPEQDDEMPEGLPPRKMLRKLSDLYFQFAHPWVNIFDQTHLEVDIFNSDNLTLLHGITTLGLTHWDEPAFDAAMRQQYIDNSRGRLLNSALEDISFTSAQGLAFLALDALGQGPSSRTLNIMALLNTAMTQLGLTRDIIQETEVLPDNRTRMVKNQIIESGQVHSRVDYEQRCRLFWTVYTLDRIVGVSHGFECRIAPDLFQRTMRTEEIWTPQRRIEALIEDVQRKTARAGLSDSWRILVQISTLMERVNDFILNPVDLCDFAQCQQWKSHFRALDAALTAWKESQLQPAFPGELDPVLTTANALYYTAIIRIQSVAAFPPKSSSYLTASPTAPKRCREAIESICTICESMNPGDFLKLGPLFVFSVWVAARNMVTLWTSGWEEPTAAVPPELATLRSSLHALSQVWQCAQHFTKMIDFVVDSKGEADEHSNLAVFNDVSKTAYGLQTVLGPRMKYSGDAQMAQIWDWFSIPGLELDNPFV
ncbi:uncharacterized protein F4822DRAFT_416950 [Hypoxylon trugodes]|uniref:uncharacterized protein n=1 Tax=Hypoxylon trugodes TaxID=326681 RepID=UPI002196C88E|nr:uncharacterized protein F4822DRAFT_416950 [Hypoxylon trugodes]KAI1384988.1 hypothetical protein F4822DRAFT_416950 [Hypoxylon trugodes]